MSRKQEVSGKGEKWAYFRFSVVGPLLAAPPKRGELKAELTKLANKMWVHPISGQWKKFGFATIERWYYRAQRETKDPVSVLRRKPREDSGQHPSLSPALRKALSQQYKQHPNWSYQLHADNLGALAEQNPELDNAPSYHSVRRYMKAKGLIKRPRKGNGHTAGSKAAEKRFEDFEIRSYESEYVNALWHLDFHQGSLKVLIPSGRWSGVHLMAMLDDHSRRCLHAQWYLTENAENLVHGLCQGMEKHGLPRAIMSDNGSAEIAHETVQGLERLSIVHEKTLYYSPYQNGKQENFWGQIEGRLLPMLEGCRDLTLKQLNEATIAWVEREYNNKIHSEINNTPIRQSLASKDVGRPCPDSKSLRQAFTAQISRTQRQSDGSISIDGARFEIPSRFRQMKKLTIRYAGWDLSQVYMADPHSGEIICRIYPQDKQKNADGSRRRKDPLVDESQEPQQEPGMAPLLRKIMAEYAATGVPPAYIPKDECDDQGDKL